MRHAIERDATGQTQIVERHPAFDAWYQKRDRGICRRLQCCRHIGMPRQNFRVPCHEDEPNMASILANLSG